jgi:hypothetical protein
MKANPVLIESLEARRLFCATLGEGVSGVAHEAPGAQAALVHVTQAANPAGAFGQVVASTAQNPATFPGC